MKPSMKGGLVYLAAIVLAVVAAETGNEEPITIVLSSMFILLIAYGIVTTSKFNALGDEVERLQHRSWEEQMDLFRLERELENKEAKEGLSDKEEEELKWISDRKDKLYRFESEVRAAKSKDALPSYP